MKLALPSPPRRVRVWQVPGALLRIGAAAVAGLAIVAALGVWGGGELARVDAERAAEKRAAQVVGTVSEVERGEGGARLGVLFRMEGRAYSASQVPFEKKEADALRRGSAVSLWVDPQQPDRPRSPAVQAKIANGLGARRAIAWGLPALVLVILTVGIGWLARREVRPIREGLLVWLTPKVPPDGRRRIAGHYFRQDVRHEIVARVRPLEALIRNGDKLLTAVAPTARKGIVIDERLAQQLRWTRPD